MLKLQEGVKVFIHLEPTDMRKSIDGLCALIVDQFQMKPQSTDLFVFYNQSKNKVKIVYWDRNGFILHYKRLERGRFIFSKMNSGGTIEITEDQLSWLLAGLNFQLMNEFSELNYSEYY